MAEQILTVDLTGLTLKKEHLASIEAAVRNAALSEIARLTPSGTAAGVASGSKFLKDVRIRGIWITDLNKLALEKLAINQ